MRIVIISDTHQHPIDKLTIPEGDLLIHAGDLTGSGSLQEVFKAFFQLNNIKYRYTYGIVCIAGNHDFYCEEEPNKTKDMTHGLDYLVDQEVIINGYKVYGSPFQPEFYSWAFNLPRGKILREKWSKIPEDTDILVTHGPPWGLRDMTDDMLNVGCSDLRERVFKLKLKIHAFGHIHSGYGMVEEQGTKFVNASICTEQYLPINKPFVIDIER